MSLAVPTGLLDARRPMRGRGNILAELGTCTADVVVISGLGGSGKTRLAAEAAYAAQRDGRRVWWVSAAQREAMEAGMREAARHLGAEDRDLARGMAADEVWRRLEVCPGRWLLVIDSADEPQALVGETPGDKDGRGWLRPVLSPNGLVIVTSREGRKGAWAPWCRLVRLGMLPPAEAGEVLADFAGRSEALGSAADARSLAARMGGLPLALKIAGAYLEEAAAVPVAFSDGLLSTYAGYQEAMERGGFWRAKPARCADLSADTAQDLIGITGEITLRLLEKRPVPHVRQVLFLLSAMADAPVPYRLLDAGLLGRSKALAGATGPQLWQALNALTECGFTELHDKDGEVPTVRLHPLVRDTARSLQSAGSQLETLGLAARLVARAADDDPEDPATWRAWQFTSAHAAHLLRATAARPRAKAADVTAAAIAAHQAARFCRAQGWLSRATSLLQDVVAAQSTLLGPRHLSTLAARHSAARIRTEAGDLAGAEAEFRDILAARLEVLGPDHPDAIATQFEMALIEEERGNISRAEQAFRDVLAASSRTLGADHLATLTAKYEVAYTVGILGRHAESEALFREVFRDRQETLGASHPDTLAARHRIAWAKARAGEYKAAETMFAEVLRDKIQALGAGHPSTLASQYQLARAIGEQGDYHQAEAIFRKVQIEEARVLGPDHPHTLATRYEVARMTGQQGYLDDEQAAQQAILETRTHILGPDHPETLASRHRIAALQAAQGKLAQAQAAFSDVLQARLHILGPDHPDTLSTMHRIASVQARRGDTASARRGFRDVLTARRQQLGASHPDTLTTQEALKNLASRGS